MTNLQAIDLLKGLEQSLDDYCELIEGGPIACKDLAAAMGKSNDNMRMTLKRKKKDLEKAGYVFDDGVVRKK